MNLYPSRIFVLLLSTSLSTAFTTSTTTPVHHPLQKASSSALSAVSWSSGGEDEASSPITRRFGSTNNNKSYLVGDDLIRLRNDVLKLRKELVTTTSAIKRLELQRAILQAQQMDAEFVYLYSSEKQLQAQARGRWTEAEIYEQQAQDARKSLPQFNLEGLWVGKYDQGYEMINITYAGDVLRAYKVTGDGNVPKGEVSFEVDLSPQKAAELEPIELGPEASEQWNTQYLTRFVGEGQVAAKDFSKPQYVEGQLILVDEYFSFAWIPLGIQVFFGRPSAELTLKMLREASEGTGTVDKERALLERCLDETHCLQEDFDSEQERDGGFSQHDYYDMQGYFE